VSYFIVIVGRVTTAAVKPFLDGIEGTSLFMARVPSIVDGVTHELLYLLLIGGHQDEKCQMQDYLDQQDNSIASGYKDGLLTGTVASQD